MSEKANPIETMLPFSSTLNNNNNNSRPNSKSSTRPILNDTDTSFKINERYSVNDIWPEIESYLIRAAHTIRTGSTEMMERLRDSRHRMSWYAIIYSTCNGHPRKSRDMYQHLVIFLLNDLEVNVLRPFLHRGASGFSPSSSLCHQFALQYKLFMNFRRVVLSCFSYLDQYYTVKFRLDSVTALCVKMFYVVVYGPIKEMLIEEMIYLANEARIIYQNGRTISSACTDVQQALEVIVDILTTVRNCSNLSESEKSSLRLPYIQRQDVITSHNFINNNNNNNNNNNSRDARSTLDRIAAEIDQLQKSLSGVTSSCVNTNNNNNNITIMESNTNTTTIGTPMKTPPRASSIRALFGGGGGGSSNNNNNNNNNNSRERSNRNEREGSESSISSALTGSIGYDLKVSISLENIRILRERLESRSFADLLVGQSTALLSGNNYSNNNNNNGNYTSYNMTRDAAGRCILDSDQAVIINITQPLYILIFSDFALRYVRAAASFYRDQRTLQLVQLDGRRNYLQWVKECFELERALVKDVNIPLFYSTLREELHHVLLVEVHRLIILDEEFGFRAQLDAWDGRSMSYNAQISSLLPNHNSSSGVRNNNNNNNSSTGVVLANSTSSRRVSYWDQISHDELLRKMKTFVLAFVNTQDESSCVLLASEFASKIVIDTAVIFTTYMNQIKEISQQNQSQQQQQKSIPIISNLNDMEIIHNNNNNNNNNNNTMCKKRPVNEEDGVSLNDIKPNTIHDAAMRLINKLVNAAIQYGNLLREQFNSYPALQAAMGDAFREIINPERWGQLGVRVPLQSMISSSSSNNNIIISINNTNDNNNNNNSPTSNNSTSCNFGISSSTELPCVLLNHDAAKKILTVLNKLGEMRGSSEIPISVFLANYCDQLCNRVGNNNNNNNNNNTMENNDFITECMTHVAYLAALLDAKDIFLEHYKIQLARRLLTLSQSSSTQIQVEGERIMIHKLQQALGRSLTYSLESMLRDYESTANVSEGFRQTINYNTLQAKLKVQILTAAHWPSYRIIPFIPCNSLEIGIKYFTDYYTGIHPSRTLRWIHTLGAATLNAIFPKGTKEIIANTIQATILILVSDAYNNNNNNNNNSKDKSKIYKRSISGYSIAAAMGMNFQDLRFHLAPLIQNKIYNILTRIESSQKVIKVSNILQEEEQQQEAKEKVSNVLSILSPNDEFTLNVEYTHKLRKFKLPIARLRSSQSLGETQQTNVENNLQSSVSSTIEDTRRLQIDAAIIRVMKSRRSLRYYELLDATIQQLSKLFSPRPRAVKTQVEDLVGRGFLRRSETDATIFEYVA